MLFRGSDLTEWALPTLFLGPLGSWFFTPKNDGGKVRFMKNIIDLVSKLAAPIAEAQGCVLWDVEYAKEAGQRFLRVYIDRDEGVTINQCEAVSRALETLLDEEDPIEEAYILEVSSAGAERALKRPSDFEKFIGSNVAVKLYAAKEGRKEYVGLLKRYSDGDVEIDAANRSMLFKKSEIANVRLRVIF
jgi:ribosome maturation factor RimP